MQNGTILGEERTQPMYTISEAALLANVAAVTVRRWLRGYAPDSRHPEWRKAPVFGPKDGTTSLVSFLQLIEIVVASDFRKLSRLKLDVIRSAHENLRHETQIEYPFAHVKLDSLGDHVVRWLKDQAQAVDSPHQFSLPGLIEQRTREMAARRLSELDFERELASRWHPEGKEIPIVVDPQYSAGAPTVEGFGVTIQTVYNRWKAKQPITFIASDLALEPQIVERVLQYADKIAA